MFKVIATTYSLFQDITASPDVPVGGRYCTPPPSARNSSTFTSPPRNLETTSVPLKHTPSRVGNVPQGGKILDRTTYTHTGLSLKIEEGSVLGEGGEGTVYKALVSGISGFALKVNISVNSREASLISTIQESLPPDSPYRQNLSIPLNTNADLLLLYEQARGDMNKLLIEKNQLNSFLMSDSHPQLKEGVLLHIMLQMLNATKIFQHTTKHCHCDIKPENFLVSGTNRLLLHDFGAASEAHSTDVLGSFSYRSPESSEDHRGALKINETLSAKSDVFSIGASLCQLITGANYYTLGDNGIGETMAPFELKNYLLTYHSDTISDPSTAYFDESDKMFQDNPGLSQIFQLILKKMLPLQPKERATINELLDIIIPKWESLVLANPNLENEIKEVWKSWT